MAARTRERVCVCARACARMDSGDSGRTAAAYYTPTKLPKRPGFFRLLLRNTAHNKQGLAIIVLAGSCLFLSSSMLDHKHRLEQLQQQYSILSHENEQLRQTLGSVNEIVSEASGQADAPQPITDSSAASYQTKGKGTFMV